MEHHWLQKLAGEWTFETEAVMAPDKPPEEFKGSKTVRSLGEVWVRREGHREMPGDGTAKTQIIFRYDPNKKRFLGTLIGSMITHIWPCDGASTPGARCPRWTPSARGSTPKGR